MGYKVVNQCYLYAFVKVVSLHYFNIIMFNNGLSGKKQHYIHDAANISPPSSSVGYRLGFL